MDKGLYKPRIIDDKVKQYLSAFGAICIEGPKWCGKTWTSGFHSKSEFFVGDPANQFQNRKLAELSTDLILEGENPRLIDEWQEVPLIWDAVRHEVDKRSKKGQFILTGSSTPKRKGIMHSGAGRIGRIRMRPMSLFESGHSSGEISLQKLCQASFTQTLIKAPDLHSITEFIIRGGWPGNQDGTIEDAALLPADYLNAIVEDDMYRTDGIKRDKQRINLLLRSLARNVSTTATNRTLIRDIKDVDDKNIGKDTIADYLDLFERLYLTDNQRPFSSNIRSSIRVKQAEKRHFADPSLAAALLNVTPEKLINDLESLGFLFESLCIRDLKIYAESFGGQLYHYQDYNNNEIDAVIELSDGSWCAFEIKLGASQAEAAGDNLIKINKAIAKGGGKVPLVSCVISGLTNAAYQLENGVYVVPITALGP